jgi:hypothetical protein
MILGKLKKFSHLRANGRAGGAVQPIKSVFMAQTPRKRTGTSRFKTETEASIRNKLARGTFPATFFLACLAALQLDGVALEEI